MLRIQLSVTMIFLIFSHANAQQVMGAGAKTCGEFSQQYGSNPQLSELMFYSWAQGWLTSESNNCELLRTIRSVEPKTGKNQNPGESCPVFVTSDFGTEEHRAFLRRFCAENPLRTYYDAVLSLVDHINRKRGLTTGSEEIEKFKSSIKSAPNR